MVTITFSERPNQEWLRRSGKPNWRKWGSRTFREGVREFVPEPPCLGVLYSIYKQKGVPKPVPDSFPGSSQTSPSSVWFAGAPPDQSWPRFAIVRACYTMENGPNDKNGKKMGRTWKICPDRKWGKMAEKHRKNGKSGRFSIFSPSFDRGKFSTFFPFFPIFVIRPVFHCVAGPHDCKPRLRIELLTPKPRFLNKDLQTVPKIELGPFWLGNLLGQPKSTAIVHTANFIWVSRANFPLLSWLPQSGLPKNELALPKTASHL